MHITLYTISQVKSLFCDSITTRKQISSGAVFTNREVSSPSCSSHGTQESTYKPPKQRQGLALRRTTSFDCLYNDDRTCCKRNCHNRFQPELIESYRLSVLDYAMESRRTRIFEYHTQNLVVDSRPCCINYLTNCFDVSRSWLYPNPTTTDRDRQCPKTISVLAWFENLKANADVMPDAQAQKHVHRPVAAYQIPHLKKKEVFKEYMADCKLHPTLYLQCTKAHFLTTWKKTYPNVKLRKYLKFAKCEVCVDCREIKKNPASTSEQKKAACVKQEVHWLWVKKERAGELARQQEAIYSPLDTLTITQDGTDFPFVAGIPSLPEKSKKDGELRIKPTIMVTISHGDGVFIFPALPHIAKDPNFTIECIQRTLKKVETSRGMLPPKLHLQLDNCGRENKNTALIAYLSWLVERGVFKTIELHFLPVGHTHNLADQVNSRVTTAAKHANIRDRKELCDVLETCYDPNPYVEFVDHVASVKQLFNPKLSAQWTGSRVH